MRYGAGLIPQQEGYLNRQELVKAVARSGDSKAATGDLVNAVFEIIAGALTQGDSVQLAGFGSFPVGVRAPRSPWLNGALPASGCRET